MSLRKFSRISVFLLLILSFSSLTAQESIYEQKDFTIITELTTRNREFKQYQKDIENASKMLFAGKQPHLSFYKYTCNAKDDLISLSSRCCIPYDTIVTLNSIDSADFELNGKTLFLPTVQGLFINKSPRNRMELILGSSRNEENATQKVLIDGKELVFYRNDRFTPSERAFFLTSGMNLPLSETVITSSFGMRKSPISGKWKFHNGIDLAAPLGSPVFSCKAGIVEKAAFEDEVYGNYLIIRHSVTLTSLYAHLGNITVKEGEKVLGGQKIAEVGLTGLTTGPHLHFEVKNDGRAENPKTYLKLDQQP